MKLIICHSSILCLLIIQLTCSKTGFAQELDHLLIESVDTDLSKYTVRFHMGTTGSLMAGEWAKEQQIILVNSDTTYLSYGQFKPSFGYYFGGNIDYSVNQNIGIGLGLTVLQRRFKQNSQYNYYHPMALYDEEMTNEITYQTTYLNVPLRIRLTSLKRVRPFVGIAAGLLLSSKADVLTTETTVINNEIDPEGSGTIRDTRLDQKDNTQKLLFSFESGIEIPVNKRWDISLSAERTTRIFKSVNAHLWTGKIALSYQFNY